MLKILPSIASSNPLELSAEIARIQKLGRLHLDIEDGNFIDNITFGLRTIQAITHEFKGTIDAHLMTTRPEDWLLPLSQAGISLVCGHIEALPYPMRFLKHAHRLAMKAGLAFNLKTRPEEILPYIDELDYVLVMTSEPDYEDQSFFPCSYERVSQFRHLVKSGTEIWCDGGIGPANLQKLYSAGMNAAVMGRSIFTSDHPADTAIMYERSVI